MNGIELEVEIMDGDRLVEQRSCRRATLNDGTSGVVWRGVLYPLLLGDRIDVAVPAPTGWPTGRSVVLPGDEATRLLLQGTAADRAAARRAVEARGIVVLRDGRWLGDPVGGVVYDQFLVCEGSLTGAELGEALSTSAAQAAADPAVTIALLEQRLADAHADLASLEAKLSRDLARPRAEISTVPSATALEEALMEVAAMRARLDGLGAAPPAVRPVAEFAGILGALRPEIRMLRDGLAVAVGEFSDRLALWRSLGELPSHGTRPATGWKTLQGIDGWIERHVSTGRNNQGRLYAVVSRDVV